MKTILMILVCALTGCGSESGKHANPQPEIGAILSDDYDGKWINEQNQDYTKWLIRTGDCLNCYYYVTCNRDGKVLSIWRR